MKNDVNKECTMDLMTNLEHKEPPFYQIHVHNDEHTPMEFVMGLLELFFGMNKRQAAEVMLEAHMTGKAECGKYTREVAESKLFQVSSYIDKYEHPLTCSMEAAW